MAQKINQLTDKKVRDAQPKDGGKPRYSNDGNNLCLGVTLGAKDVVHKVWLAPLGRN